MNITERREIVKKKIHTMSCRELAKELGVSPKTISNDAKELGIKISNRKSMKVSSAKRPTEKLSKEDRDRYVIDNYEYMTLGAIADATGWSLTTIKSVARRYGLVESPHIRDAIRGNPNADHYEISKIVGCKVDCVRDTMKAMGVFVPINPPKEKKPPKVESYVYIIRIKEGIYKVGKSDSPNRRFSQLCSSAPEQYESSELLLAFKSSDAFSVEQDLRSAFTEYVNIVEFDGYTEWVYASDADIMRLAYKFIEKEYIST